MTIHPELSNEEMLEKYAHITNESLIFDYENTKDETLAYSKLSEGFYTLSRLPETNNIDKRLHYSRSREYADRKEQCQEFLEFLAILANARHLDLVGPL